MKGRHPAPGIRSEPTDRIERALDPGSVGEVRALFREYASQLGFSLEFQGFDRELVRLPGEYAPPSGARYLARVGRDPAGCVAVRDLGDRTCEMKRLYVRPGYRGHGLGRRLAERAIAEARRLRYARMRLDTVAGMTEALALYRDLGFRAIAAYRFNPRTDAAYFELELK
jgi:GNAT superfamily N-acetyltransferase